MKKEKVWITEGNLFNTKEYKKDTRRYRYGPIRIK